MSSIRSARRRCRVRPTCERSTPASADHPATRLRKATVHGWRMATADLRGVPKIVIIGAQRSGTTSLHSWLCSHPDVSRFMIKEVHYFDGAYEKGERFYRSRFPISPHTRTHVQASPYMLYHPLAAERAGRDLPQDTRFVALLREPAERALSHYQFERRKGQARIDRIRTQAFRPFSQGTAASAKSTNGGRFGLHWQSPCGRVCRRPRRVVTAGARILSRASHWSRKERPRECFGSNRCGSRAPLGLP